MSGPSDGGQAFPVGEYGGMSLRDYFAAQALTGLLVMSQSTIYGIAQNNTESVDLISGAAFVMADAMLAARGRK